MLLGLQVLSVLLRPIHNRVNVCVCVCVCVKLQHCVYGMLRQTQRMGSEYPFFERKEWVEAILCV